MPEEGKTDSESSCSFFGKRKALIPKNALCLRRKRTRKAVVSSSKKERRLSEKNENSCRFVCVYSSLQIITNFRGLGYGVGLGWQVDCCTCGKKPFLSFLHWQIYFFRHSDPAVIMGFGRIWKNIFGIDLSFRFLVSRARGRIRITKRVA